MAGADHAEQARGVGCAAARRHGNAQLAPQVARGERLRMPEHVSERPGGYDLSTVAAGARPEIDHVVRRANRLLVVLDDQHGVAQVAQLLQGGEQPFVVPLVQADRRLIEDVQHPHEPAADLRGEADALRFAPRERRR